MRKTSSIHSLTRSLDDFECTTEMQFDISALSFFFLTYEAQRCFIYSFHFTTEN